MFACLKRKILIDLGTTSTLVYIEGKGLVMQEASLVALEKNNKIPVAVGNQARLMLGRTPEGIITVKPVTEGVINNFEIAGLMLRNLISRVNNNFWFFRPELILSIPKGITRLEKEAVSEIAGLLGTRTVKVIEEPMAAAIGAGLPVEKPLGSMVVDIGGGITEAVVISLGETVVSRSSRVAGDRFNEAIISHFRKIHNFEIGENSAEKIKLTIGSTCPENDYDHLEIAGINLKKGLPEILKISAGETREVLATYVNDIIRIIRETLEITPPELAGDIFEKGIYLTGGGALLRGIDKTISRNLGLTVKIARDPAYAVARGMYHLTAGPAESKRQQLEKKAGMGRLGDALTANGLNLF